MAVQIASGLRKSLIAGAAPSVPAGLVPPVLRRTDSAAAGAYFLVTDEDKSPPAAAPIVSTMLTVDRGLPRGPGKGRSAVASLPPMLNITPTSRNVFRYSSTAAITLGESITHGMISGSLGGICTVTNSTLVHWTSSLRLHSLRVWPAVSTSSVANTLVEWTSGYSGQTPDRGIDVCTPLGVSTTPCLAFIPPKQSLASFWSDWSGASTSLFTIYNLPSGSVLDLDVSYTHVLSKTTGSSTIATGVLGTVYYLPLDGTTNHKIAHVSGYPQTF